MTSFPAPKCVLRLSAILALTGALLLAAGCRSGGGLPPILSGNYTNASLKGQYVVSQTGIGANQQNSCCDPFSEVFVFTADGNGNLTVTVDDFDQVGGPFEDTNLSGAYSINKDGTGSLQINFPGSNPSNYAITLIDDSHFHIIEQDLFATASGFGQLQDTTAFSAPPSGKFVFKMHEVNTSSQVGGIMISNGAFSGNEDLLNLGAPATTAAISSAIAMTTPDANGKGTFTLTGQIPFNYYVVNSSKFLLLSHSGSLEIGQAEAQSGSFSPATLAAGTFFVFGSAGDTGVGGQAGIHSAGVFSTDGVSAISGAGTVDYVADQTVHSNVAISGGSYTLDSSGRGLLNISLTGDVISPQIFWMVDATHAYFLVNSSLAVEDGTFTIQQALPANPVAPQSAFVMDGFDAAFKDRTGSLQTSSGTGNSFKWNQAANSFDTNPADPTFGGSPTLLPTTGTITVGSNGRATVLVNGVTSNLVFYFSSNGSGVMVQEDTNSFGGVNDIGGSFSLQASQ